MAQDCLKIVSRFLSHPVLFVVMSECFSCKMQIDSDVKFCPGCGADQANKRLKQSLTGEGQAIVAAINGSLGAKIDVVDNKLTVFAAAPRTYQALRGCLQLHNIYIVVPRVDQEIMCMECTLTARAVSKSPC